MSDAILGLEHISKSFFGIGALLPGIALSLLFYYLTIPLVQAYQNSRAARSKEQSEKRGRLRAALLEAASRLKPKADRDGTDDQDPPVP